jgi:hypothetical protein
MANASQGLVGALVARYAARLRFPQLFAFTGTLFLLDMLIPDLIPFMDEMMLGLLTLLLGMWRKTSPQAPSHEGPKPPVKDITPED